MTWQSLIYPIALFIAAIVSAAGAVVAWQRQPARGARWLALAQVATSEWALCAGFRALAVDLPNAILWASLSYVGIFMLSLFQLFFAITFAHLDHWLTQRTRFLLWAIPAITMVLVSTNTWHHLIWTDFTPSPSTTSRMYIFHYGPAFWIALAYFYVLNLTSAGLLAWVTLRRQDLYRRQALALLLSYPLPWVSSLLHLFTNGTLGTGYDYTPLTFTLGSVMLLWGFYRFHLLDVIPVAQDVLIDTMSEGVLVLDTERRIVELNPASETLVGPKSEVLGKRIDEFSPNCAAILADYEESDETQADVCIDETLPRYLDLRISPLFHASGDRLGQLIIWRDITESKQAERQLIRQQQDIAVMEERERLGRALHDDLGQVMSYINVQTQSAVTLLEERQSAQARKLLQQLVDVAQETQNRVREYILGMRSDDAVRSADFFTALHEYLNAFETRYGIATDVIRPPDMLSVPLVSNAEIQLLRIIQEALMNVYKHANVDAARIIFSLADKHVKVVIADEGSGFDAAMETTNHFGLNIMQERAEMVNGRLEIHAQPNRGTQISVWLPRKLNPVPDQTRDRDVKGTRVLLVDDHPLFLDGLRNMLTARGFQIVGTAQDGYEAQDMVAELAPDLVLMDVQMPRCDGLDALQQIKRTAPETNIVMLTMGSEDEQVFDALLLGASGYLLKNLDSTTFFDLLTEILHGEVVLSPGLAVKALLEMGSQEQQPSDKEAVRSRGHGTFARLTDRQHEVLQLIAEGMTYKQAALKLHLSESTIKYHMGRILEQLQLENRRAAVAYARRRGIGDTQ